MTEKPLNVQVAEALGYTGFEQVEEGDPADLWLMDCPCTIESCAEAIPVPRYDTDWATTGLLIEEYGIDILHGPQILAKSRMGGLGIGDTELIAVCHLILELAKEGKLDADPDPV